MIITRTPFRISFFGGGTDYPAWYKEYGGGAVLSTTIDKYSYVMCRYLPPFFDHKHRVVWSKIENVKDLDEIEHPVVRETLKHMNIEDGVEIHHHGDLPGRAGLGSSSSFAVGLLHALHALKGKVVNKRTLAQQAIHIEQERLKENVGSQDQVAAAFGGLNKIIFAPDNTIQVQPVTLHPDKREKFQKNFQLFFTGLARYASDVVKEQIENTPKKIQELQAMRQMVDAALQILETQDQFDDFGRLLHETWQLKRGLSSRISNDFIDEAYKKARDAGALGGKLLGAGGGGFLLLYTLPEKQEAVRAALAHCLHVPFKFDNSGSQIIHFEGA